MQKVIEIIEYENESHRVDFKMIEYPLGKVAKKNEILKDFSAFANHFSDEDKFIIIGIKENDDKTKKIVGIENPTDDAKFQQFLNDNIEPKINFEYQHIDYQDKTISYFRLFNNTNRPYLFKKDAINPESGKIRFRYGDGFIRVGTSTKKIGRKEFNDIILNKEKYRNRKNDIELTPVVGKTSNDYISQWGLVFLDLNIVNKSNKSINLDIEIKIKKSNEYQLMIESDLLNKIEEIERKKEQSNSVFSKIVPNIPYLDNIHLDVQETETELIVSRNPIKSKTAIILSQNSKEEDIFCQSILLLKNSSKIIKAEAIVRSDEFTNGAITKELIFKTENIS